MILLMSFMSSNAGAYLLLLLLSDHCYSLSPRDSSTCADCCGVSAEALADLHTEPLSPERRAALSAEVIDQMMGLPPGRKDEGMYLQAARAAAMAGNTDKVWGVKGVLEGEEGGAMVPCCRLIYGWGLRGVGEGLFGGLTA